MTFPLHDPYKLRKLKLNLNTIEQAELKYIIYNQKKTDLEWFSGIKSK